MNGKERGDHGVLESVVLCVHWGRLVVSSAKIRDFDDDSRGACLGLLAGGEHDQFGVESVEACRNNSLVWSEEGKKSKSGFLKVFCRRRLQMRTASWRVVLCVWVSVCG